MLAIWKKTRLISERLPASTMNYQACVALVLPIWHVLDDTRLPCQPAATCHGQPKQYEVLKPPKRSEIMWISRWISVGRKVWWLNKKWQNLNHTYGKKKVKQHIFPSLWFSWIYLLPYCREAVFSTNPRHLSIQPKIEEVYQNHSKSKLLELRQSRIKCRGRH